MGITRYVRQYQFKEWPSTMEENSSAVEIAAMCHDIETYQKSKVVFNVGMNIYGNQSAINEQESALQRKPVVVHDSAGVGKTGAFIAFQIGMEKLEDEGKVDIPSVIKHLRTQRMSMVQTPQQLEYV